MNIGIKGLFLLVFQIEYLGNMKSQRGLFSLDL